MNKATLAVVTVIIVVAVGLAAQSTPDFSGHWTCVATVPQATIAPLPDKFVKQTADSLAESHEAQGGGSHQVVYKLDGSESKTSMSDVSSTARASWRGDKLEIQRTSIYSDGRKRITKQTWSLDKNGSLVIESLDGLAGDTPMARTTTYKKR